MMIAQPNCHPWRQDGPPSVKNRSVLSTRHHKTTKFIDSVKRIVIGVVVLFTLIHGTFRSLRITGRINISSFKKMQMKIGSVKQKNYAFPDLMLDNQQCSCRHTQRLLKYFILDDNLTQTTFPST
jgi:hypothetical protein